MAVPKNVRQSSTHYCIMKIPNKQEVWEIAFNHLSVVDFQVFMNLYKKGTAKPCFFLVTDTNLVSFNLIMGIDDKIRD